MDWDASKTWIVIEFDEDGLPYGKYLQKDFVRKPVPYEDYLGAWSVWGSYNLTISEKEAGKTFNIKGINNQIRSPYNPSGDVILIEGTYDEKTGQMSVASQEIAPAYEYNGNTYVDILAANSSYYENVGETLFYGDIKKNDEDKYYILLSPAEEDYWQLVYKTYADWGQWNEFATSKTYIGYPWYYKAVEEDPSEKYQAWLGNWKIGDKTFTISKNVANHSYKLGSFGEDTEINAIVDFDAETGTILFNHAKTGVNISKDGRYYEYYSVGQDADGNFVWGSNNQEVAVIALQEDGTAKIIPATVTTWMPYYEANGYTEWSTWSIIGTFWGLYWDYDEPMRTNGEWYVIPNIWMNDGDEFKFRKDYDWAENYGGTFTAIGKEFGLVQGGDNIVIPESGLYDILFNPETMKAKIIYSEPSIENTYKLQTAKIGVAPYNAGAGWDKEKAIMFDISSIVTPVKESAALSKMKAVRVAKPVRQNFYSKHLNISQDQLVVKD